MKDGRATRQSVTLRYAAGARRAIVAQTVSLLYRRLAVGWAFKRGTAPVFLAPLDLRATCRLPTCDTAACHSALRRLRLRGSYARAGGLRLAGHSRLIHDLAMAWTCLIIAGILEIGWAVGLKYTDGFSRLWPSVATLCTMIASFALLSVALKTIPVGTGYAVWTGIGAAGTAIIGMAFLGEPRELPRILCIMLIIAGVVGLKLVSTGKP